MYWAIGQRNKLFFCWIFKLQLVFQYNLCYETTRFELRPVLNYLSLRSFKFGSSWKYVNGRYFRFGLTYIVMRIYIRLNLLHYFTLKGTHAELPALMAPPPPQQPPSFHVQAPPPAVVAPPTPPPPSGSKKWYAWDSVLYDITNYQFSQLLYELQSNKM